MASGSRLSRRSSTPRFKPPKHQLPRSVRWPAFEPKDPTTPFSARPPLRELVVVVDHDILPEANGEAVTPQTVLAGLLTHPYIALLRYADEGPPADAPRENHPHVGETIPGWLIVDLSSGDPYHRRVAVASKDSIRYGAITGNATDVAEGDRKNPAYDELDEDGARARRRADAIAVQAADVGHADMFITGRPYLHAVTWDLAGDVVVVAPEDALPLISLYLRSQGAYITMRGLDGRSTHYMNRGLFYWVGVRELLPTGWRWFAACVQHGANDDQVIYLGQSVFQRTQRALQARDDAHRALNQPPNNDTAEDVLGNVDLVLLALMGAVDVSARVAHRALELTGSEKAAGWQRTEWLKKVRKADPDLAVAVAAGTPNGLMLKVLNTLRNSIHGAALDALGVSEVSMRREKTLVGLPHSDAIELVEAMDRLGGREAWGIRELLPDRVHADPGLLLDRLFSGTLELLNSLLRLTPVERLSGVALSSEHSHPPRDGGFEEWNRKSIRWQLGL